MAGTIHEEYPDAALVSEWNNPEQALGCGFDMDFMLDWGGNGYNRLMRFYQLDKKGNIVADNSYFKADSTRDMTRFLEDYLPDYEATKDIGLRCFITGNHDTSRPAPFLNDTERRLAFTFLFTMPGAPFLYYGDEIGMRYRWLPTKEGGYQRTGSRTPMQWNNEKNLGFSTADADKLYLPVDPAEDAPTVAHQETDPNSMLNHMRKVINLRHEHESLQSYSPFHVYFHKEGCRMFAYKRGNYLLAVNPGLQTETLELDGNYEVLFSIGDATISEKTALLSSQSFLILKPCE
jgi:maltose alpha-D-glucosyltransferase/alpha-amylase